MERNNIDKPPENGDNYGKSRRGGMIGVGAVMDVRRVKEGYLGGTDSWCFF